MSESTYVCTLFDHLKHEVFDIVLSDRDAQMSLAAFSRIAQMTGFSCHRRLYLVHIHVAVHEVSHDVQKYCSFIIERRAPTARAPARVRYLSRSSQSRIEGAAGNQLTSVVRESEPVLALATLLHERILDSISV